MGEPVALDAGQELCGDSPPRSHVVVVDWRGDWNTRDLIGSRVLNLHQTSTSSTWLIGEPNA